MTDYFNIKWRKLETSNIKDRERKTAHVSFSHKSWSSIFVSLFRAGFLCPKVSPILRLQFDRKDGREEKGDMWEKGG